MPVDEQKNETLLQGIANEKNNSSNKDLKNFVSIVQGPLWDRKVVKIKWKANQNPLPAKTNN